MGNASKLFGKRISLFLTDRGWKQADLVRITGIGQTQISNYIKGKVSPGLEIVEKIAAALERPIADFFKDEITLTNRQVESDAILKLIQERNDLAEELAKVPKWFIEYYSQEKENLVKAVLAVPEKDKNRTKKRQSK